MIDSKNEIQQNRSIQDKAYDLLGQLLIERQTEKLLAAIEEEKARSDTARMDTFFAKQDQINLAKIHRYCRKEKTKRFFQQTLPKLAQVAAIVIAVVSLAGGVAIATSHTVRVHVMQLLINIEDEYTELKLVEDESASFDVPAEWKGKNYLSYVPDGLRLINAQSLGGLNYAEYADIHTGEIRLRFRELSETSEGNVDTEDVALSTVAINGQIGYMAIKEETIKILWSDGYNYFILTTLEISKEETLAIAESLKRIK